MPPQSPSLKGTIVIAAIAVLFACMAIVFFATLKRRDRDEVCRNNLRHLGVLVGRASPADEPLWDRVPTGSAFWLNSMAWPNRPPLAQSLLLCPVYKPVRGRTGTDYRGPARSLRELDMRDPIGADKPGNHGAGQGGNVLLRSGEFFPAAEGDPWWQRAATTTSE